jgi:6-pyruvoyltetrahydropterin/6-carboxytetrahydropterin synthase
MPTLISREVEFDAGHRVPNHESKCRNPHGHRYRVVATITGRLVDRSGASDEGMVVDFGRLSELLKKYVHDIYDHGFIVHDSDQDMLTALDVDANETNPTSTYGWKVIVVDWIPTAENMARAIFEDLWDHVMDLDANGRVTLAGIDVYETPKSKATYWAGV